MRPSVNTKGCYKSPRHAPDWFRSQPKGDSVRVRVWKNWRRRTWKALPLRSVVCQLSGDEVLW